MYVLIVAQHCATGREKAPVLPHDDVARHPARTDDAGPASTARELAARLNALPAPEDARPVPFAVTYPDEIRAVFTDPVHAVGAALCAIRERGVLAGIGVGGVELGGDEPEGPALGYARAAIERCTAGLPCRAIAVEGGDPGLSDAITSLLRMLARLIDHRTEAEWRVVDLLVPDVRGQHRAIAEALGISPQAVSKALIRTGWHEETAARASAVELLARL